MTDLLPEGFNHVFFTNSGSEANDTIFAWCIGISTSWGSPTRKSLLAEKRYHGSTIAAASLGEWMDA